MPHPSSASLEQDWIQAAWADVPLDNGAPHDGSSIGGGGGGGGGGSGATCCVAGGAPVRGAPTTTRNGVRRGALHWAHFGLECASYSNLRQGRSGHERALSKRARSECRFGGATADHGHSCLVRLQLKA